MLGIVFAGPAIKNFKVNLSGFQIFLVFFFRVFLVGTKNVAFLFQCYLSTKLKR